jgi:hypothetical protein
VKECQQRDKEDITPESHSRIFKLPGPFLSFWRRTPATKTPGGHPPWSWSSSGIETITIEPREQWHWKNRRRRKKHSRNLWRSEQTTFLAILVKSYGAKTRTVKTRSLGLPNFPSFSLCFKLVSWLSTCRRSPMNRGDLEHYLHEHIPLSRAMGVVVIEADWNGVTLSDPSSSQHQS